MKEAVLYEKLEHRKVSCTACKLKCRISEGKSGVCGVRINKKGKLYLAVYGRASAMHVDPIEKKPLFHFLPGENAFSIGTVGCNFGCAFCQNWDLSQVTRSLRNELQKAKKTSKLGLEVSKYGYDLPPEKVVQICTTDEILIIAYTYNEPAIFFEYASDCAHLADQYGIKNIFVSNGYETLDGLEMIHDKLHAINIDLKAFTNRFYQKVCQARLQPVLDTIEEIYHRGIWLEITTLLIPGENDSEPELKDIASFIARLDPDIPWHISRFHPAHLWTHISSTEEKSLMRAYEIGRSEGLHFVYLGNFPGTDKENTRCPECHQLLIKRSGYKTQILPSFMDGTCGHCHTKIAGVWK